MSEFLESNTESSRKLASIRTVESVVKHGNADALEIVTLQDMFWQVIVRLGDVRVGDKVVYFEIDSLLPTSAPWFPASLTQGAHGAKVSKSCMTIDDESYFRIKTIKLRGEISQGLILPFDDSLKQAMGVLEALDGFNATLHLQVKKYEPNVRMGGRNHGGGPKKESSGIPFPTHLVSKTDETRVQTCKADFIALLGQPYYITVKCDGMSATFLIDPETNDFLVCSRNLTLPRPEFDDNGKIIKGNGDSSSQIWGLKGATLRSLEATLRKYAEEGRYFAIQGEVCGPKIQKNLLGLKENHLFVFNVIELKHSRHHRWGHLTYNEMAHICGESGLECVPLVEQGPAFSYSKISEMLALSQGFYSDTKNHREGIVVRGLSSPISFKVINNDYLLKNDY
jgi:RNA ligase (TIGR02306 family)